MGVVARVSGPVVIAEGLTGAKMFDVVRVGELGLVGEIIKLVETTATVQVYEDTTGIRPGDPVENTGQALSVELGPGLLTSIYDGIERPLDVLKKNLGDFITRGFSAPALDEKKVWTFTATAKSGDEVSSGSILGTVQETPLILHKIMVPPGTSGTVEKLTSGDYTIRDRIGSIKTGAGSQPVTLTQRWVVRIPRPVKQKLPPGIPLITGQRVIDTFFPVAKGGSACIPGPFGSGKCAAAETPVLLASGQITTIGELYASSVDQSGVTVEGNDEWLTLRTPIELVSWVGGRLVKSRTSTLYRGKSDSLVRVRTRSGRSVRVTPVHRLFALGPDGRLRGTAAGELRPGDRLASVRNFPGPASNVRLNLKLSRLRGRGVALRVPRVMGTELAEFLGLFVSSGSIRALGSVGFTPRGPEILARYQALMSRVFGVRGEVEPGPDSSASVVVHSRGLAALLEQLGVAASREDRRIPSCILASGNPAVASFLRGFCLATVGSRGAAAELSTESRWLQIDLAYAFARLGIDCSTSSVYSEGGELHVVRVRSISSLDRSSKLELPARTSSGLAGAPVTPEPPLGTPDAYADLLDVSPGMRSAFPPMGPASATPALASMGAGRPAPAFPPVDVGREVDLPDAIVGDEIVEVREESGPFDVYDCSLPEFGSNFVGGFGGLLLHNTVTQQQLAKWADSDVVVYVGCGERGNEMTEVLATFPNLQDPKSGRPLMERTILIANTSNMPVAAREASVYTGITIAEYYRDMGYDVALMADSTSRWAEAMREISGRLEEMPGEEGYPAYLGRRIAEFYERSGRVVTLSPDDRPGSVTVVGAVSPPGGDFSEPVSQNTLRVTRVFWALDASLASRRHFPSINWLNSYSLYVGDLEAWYRASVAKDWVAMRQQALELLQKEAELQEIVQLVGVDALPEREKGTLDVARMIREDYLQQSAYDDVDTYSSIQKQYRMLQAILNYGQQEQQAIARGATVAQLQKLPVRAKLTRMKTVPEAQVKETFDQIELEMGQAMTTVGGAS